jgi:nicotinamidase/pyrazinamidase
MKNVEMLIIDPQNDFCDPTGNLFVVGADKDMERLAKFVAKNYMKLGDIHVTLDTHHNLDVAHPLFWIDRKGKHPDPFTMISKDDVVNGVWRPFHGKQNDALYGTLRDRMIHYVTQLEANGRYMLIIWPPHCLIGTWGHNVYPALMEQFHRMERDRVGWIDYVTKGSNLFTEHYSGVKADVPDPQDPGTNLNSKLVETLKSADEILISGEALSHCVKFTVTDIANQFSDDAISKFVLLRDTCSSVTGFEQMGEDFVKELSARGMRLATTETYVF